MTLKNLYYPQYTSDPKRSLLSFWRTKKIKLHDDNVLQNTSVSDPSNYAIYKHDPSIAVDPTYKNCHLIYGTKYAEIYQDVPYIDTFVCYQRKRTIQEYEDSSIITQIKHNNVNKTLISAGSVLNSTTKNGIQMHNDFKKLIIPNNTLYNSYNLIWNDCSFSVADKNGYIWIDTDLWYQVIQAYNNPSTIIDYEFKEENRELTISLNYKNTTESLSKIFNNCNIVSDISIYMKSDTSSYTADYAFNENNNLSNIYIRYYNDPSFKENLDDDSILQVITSRESEIRQLISTYNLKLDNDIILPSIKDESTKYISNANYMFCNNPNLISIDASVLIQSHTGLSHMFYNNHKLRNITMNFNASIGDYYVNNNMDMSYFMANCYEIQNVKFMKNNSKPLLTPSKLNHAFENTAYMSGNTISIPLTIDMSLLSPDKCIDAFRKAQIDISLCNLPLGEWDFTNSSIIGGIEHFSEESITGIIDTLKYDKNGDSSIYLPIQFSYMESALRQKISKSKWNLGFR